MGGERGSDGGRFQVRRRLPDPDPEGKIWGEDRPLRGGPGEVYSGQGCSGCATQAFYNYASSSEAG